MNRTYRKNTIWKRLVALVLAIVLMMPNIDLNNVAYAGPGVLEQFNLTFTNIQNAEKNSDTVYFVRKNAETSIDMKLQPHFTSGTANGVEVTLGVPYLYFNEEKQIETNYSRPEGVAPKDLMSLRMSVKLPSESWIIYGTDSTTVYNADQTEDTSQDYSGKVIEEGKYFTGKVVIKYVSGLSAGDYTFELKTRFYGNALPENTAANVRAGMSYTSYTSSTGNTTTGEYSIPFGGNPSKDAGLFNDIALINTNLTWEASIKEKNASPLWNEYNYAVYEITVKNTADKEESYLDHYDLNLTLPAAALHAGIDGVLEADMMKWIYEEDGSLTENSDTNLRDKLFSGKPMEGGLLCYDVTDIPEEELAEWDLTTFQNLSGGGIKPLPYYYTSPGVVNISVDQALHSPLDKTEGHISEKRYYVAVPFKDNITSNPKTISIAFRPTIFYGGNNSFSWTKEYGVSTTFPEASAAISQDKYISRNGDDKVYTGNTGAGKLSGYFIGDIQNTGNIPSYHAYLKDTLPEDFDLDSVTIHMKGKEAELSSWFTEKEADLVQLLFIEEGQEEAEGEWVSLGQREDPVREEASDTSSWRIEIREDLEKYLLEHPEQKFAGKLRVNYKECIVPGEKLDGEIEVSGQARKVETRYINESSTVLEQPNFQMRPGGTTGGDFVYIPKELEGGRAEYLTVPSAPKVEGTAVYLPDTGKQEADSLQVPMNEENAGYHFYLWNSSDSHMMPAVFSTEEDMLSQISGIWAGFTANQIKLSKGLLERSKVTSVTLSGTEKNPDTEDGSKTIAWEKIQTDPEGNGVLTESDWQEIGKLQRVQVNFSDFGTLQAKDENCYVEILGVVNTVGERKLTGTWKTDYSEESGQKEQKVSDPGYLTVETIRPVITGSAAWKDASGKEQSGSSVPNRWGDSWYEFVFENQSESAATETDLKLTLNGLAQEEDQSVHGFRMDELRIQAKWAEAAEIEEIRFYTYGQDPEQEAPAFSLSIEEILEKYTEKDTGEIRIPAGELAGEQYIQTICIRVGHFNGEVYENPEEGDSTALHVLLHGSPEWYGKLTAKAEFLPQDPLFVDITKEGTAEMTVPDFGPYVDGTAHYRENTGKNGQKVTLPFKSEEGWYEFVLGNQSISPSGNGWVELDLSSVGEKNGEEEEKPVRGFRTEEIVIGKEYKDTLDISSIQIYGLEQTENGVPAGQPALEILPENWETDRDGNIVITLKEAVPDLEYVRAIRLNFHDFYGKGVEEAKKELTVSLKGSADWLGDLEASAVLKQEYPNYTGNRSAKNRAVLYVESPYLNLHSHIQYGNIGESSQNNSGNTDGNRTILGVPYDRDFKMWVQAENGSSPASGNYTLFAELDDVEIRAVLPLKNQDGVLFGSGQTEKKEEAYTGFHTTKILITKELLEQFRAGGLDALELYDVDAPEDPVRLVASEKEGEYRLEEGGGMVLTASAEGLVITEAQLKELGIGHFAQIIVRGTGMKVTEDADRDKIRIELEGYEDSVFGTTDVASYSSVNYVDGLKAYPVKTADDTAAYVSKMYFDTVVSASYNDNEPEKKYTVEAQAAEDYRTDYASDKGSFGDNNRLETGYKSIVSFGVDFRQYLNAGSSLPEARTYAYLDQEHQGMPYVHTESMNTAGTVEMTVNIPGDSFETYYLKVSPRNKGYLKGIQVVRKDGTVYEIGPEDWKDNAVEEADGEKFFRINLLNGLDYSDNAENYYREPSDHTQPENPVTKIKITLDINQEQYEDGSRETVKNPDYGTWYEERDPFSRNAFEITGRMIRTGTVSLTAETKLTVGGAEGRAKGRSDSGHATDGDKYKPGRVISDWSYYNRYRRYWWPYYKDDWENLYATARDMKATVNVTVLGELAQVRLGARTKSGGQILDNPENEWDDTNFKFGEESRFIASFWRRAREESNDWSGRIGYSDETVLKDRLPVIEPDKNYKYYGFLTTGIQFENDVLEHLDRIALHVKSYQTVTDTDGNVASYRENPSGDREIVLEKADLESGKITVKYESEGEEPSEAPNEIYLKEGEFLSSYEAYTSDWGGNADYSKEFGLRKSPETSGTGKEVDMAVTGKIYTYVKQPQTALGDSIKHSQNRLEVWTGSDYSEEEVINTLYNTEVYYVNDSQTKNHAVWNSSNRYWYNYDSFETAHIRGYLIPFRANYALEAMEDLYRNDYLPDNLTPSTVKFQVKAWNGADGAGEKDMTSRISAFLSENTMDGAFRLQKIHIPAEFIDGTWFKVSRLTLTGASGKQMVFSLEQLKAQDCFAKTGEEYVLDVEELLHQNPDMTVKSGIYTKAHIQKFQLEFEAAAPDIEKPETLLQAEEYLSANKKEGAAFWYEGVYADRTTEDFQKENWREWTEDSTPTFGKNPNGYAVNEAKTNQLQGGFVAADPNHDIFEILDGKPVKTASYYLSNLVGQLDVSLDRNRENGKFAYDKDDVSSEAPVNDVDKDHILPWDYVDYTIEIGADSGAPIPLEYTEAYFKAPKGQRILGWELLENTTGIEEISVKTCGSGVTPENLEPGKKYFLEKDGSQTKIREVLLSVGSYDQKEPEKTQIAAGKSLKIRVITQMTDEMGAGDTAAAELFATSAQKHGYPQFRVNDAGAGTGRFATKTDNGGAVFYSRNVYQTPLLGGSSQYGANVSSEIQFYRYGSNVSIDGSYVRDGGYEGEFEGQRMQAAVRNIRNDTGHSGNLTEEASFLTVVNGHILQGFELTELLRIDYPEGMKGEEQRKPVKVEYLVIPESEERPEAYYNYDRLEEVLKDEYWTDSAQVTEEMLPRVAKVRWTYYDISAFSALDPVIMEGVAHYQDVRIGNNTAEQADRYQMAFSLKETFTHIHTELAEPVLDGEKKTSFVRTTSDYALVSRETPVINFQTQVFASEAEASADYSPSRAQKSGYRPNDALYYRVTLQNLKAGKETGLQGRVLDPVIYDKFPSQYAETEAFQDIEKLHLKWLDAEGREKDMTDYRWEIKDLGVVEDEDTGGAMIYTPSGDKGNFLSEGKAFGTMNPSASGVSQKAEFHMYQISLVKENGTAELLPGESITMYYEARAKQDGLPMVMTRGTDGLYPSYFPRIGEYWQTRYNDYGSSYPLAPNAAGGARRIQNESIMMDMDYLHHDIGVSARKNDQTDLYEMFDGSSTYIPGSSQNGNAKGNDGDFKDYDSASGSYYQKVTYKPAVSSYTTENTGKLPASVRYVQYAGEKVYNRDYYALVTGTRTAASKNLEKKEEKERTPVVWSESRTHLQKAWLNVSSQFVPGDLDTGRLSQTGNTAADASRKYDKGRNPNEPWYQKNGTVAQRYYEKYQTALETGQRYTARLQASNYGDWGIDGVELIYTLPLGAEPVLEDGSLSVTGKILTGQNVWTRISGEKITAEVIQTPDKDAGYRAPKQKQDPRWTADTDGEENYYPAESIPYVVKITVKEPLKKWFNRGNGSGYQMTVDVPCVVRHANENENWYDRVLLRPYQEEGSQNHYYYQIYDSNYYAGGTKALPDYQLEGQDYLYTERNYYYYDYRVANGYPNTPNVNGYNIQNNEVSVAEDVNGRSAVEFDYGKADNGRVLCAQTGTSAVMRKPFLRTWTAVTEIDDDSIPGSQESGYYADPEDGNQKDVQVMVENRYWWDSYAFNSYEKGYESITHSYPMDGGSMGAYQRPVISVLLPYGIVPVASDGSRFTPDNEANQKKELLWELKGRTTPVSDTLTELEKKAAFQTEVTYEEIGGVGKDGKPNGRTEGRYLVTFWTDSPEGALLSGDLDIFAFRTVTADGPDLALDCQEEGENGKALSGRYQDIRTYASSSMEGFKFLWDGSISGNPYRVGSSFSAWEDAEEEVWKRENTNYGSRLDAVKTEYGGICPVDERDSKKPYFGAGSRYQETDEMDVETFGSLKKGQKLILTEEQKDFNRNGSNTHRDEEGDTHSDIGLCNTAKLYTKLPRLTADYTVGKTKEEAGMPFGSGEQAAVYPDEKSAFEYGDTLWFGSKLSNRPESGNGVPFWKTMSQSGAVHHSRFTFVYDLPEQVTFFDETKGHMDYYVEFYNSSEPEKGVQKLDMEALKDQGWDVEVKYQEKYGQKEVSGSPEYPTIDKALSHAPETVVIELAPPAEEGFAGYESYQQGIRARGHLSSGSWINLKIETRIDNLGSEDTVYTEGFWGTEASRTYITTHQEDGHFNTEPGCENLKYQDPVYEMYWVNSVWDSEEEEINYDKDLGEDGLPDYTDLYTQAASAAFQIRKPELVVRADTDKLGREMRDPDNAGQIISDDPNVKGNVSVKYMIDQVQNLGGAVNRLILDYAIPSRATKDRTSETAPPDGYLLETTVQEIRTGAWEVPGTYTEEERKKLNEQYRVYVFVRLSQDIENETGYFYPDTEEDRQSYDDGSWVQAGEKNGYALDANQVINDLPKGDIRQVRFVIKAGTSYADQETPAHSPVPSGFRLDVDADPEKEGKQEVSEVDPTKLNVNPLPASVTDRAAYIKVQTSQANAESDTSTHANYFLEGLTRYDDMKYVAAEEASRMGVYINPELPTMSFKTQMGYFAGSPLKGYAWDVSEVVQIDPETSKMMKYRGIVENMSIAEQIYRKGEENKDHYEEDILTDPSVSFTLPYIADLKAGELEYVDYESLLGDDPDYLSDSFQIEGNSEHLAGNLDHETPHWTWHVERLRLKEDGTPEIVNNQTVYDMVEPSEAGVRLKEEMPHYFDVVTNIETMLKRQAVSIQFEGRLQPNERIVVEFMVPIEDRFSSAVSQELLEVYAHGYKTGNFSPYIPSAADGYGQITSYERDTRDLDDDGNITEMCLHRTLSGLGFKETRSIKQMKTVDTEIHQDYDSTKGVAAVPEGTAYTFHLSIHNQGTLNETNRKDYQKILMYDVLPYPGDYQSYGKKQDGSRIERDSVFRGYLDPDSFELKYYDPSDSEHPDGKTMEMTDASGTRDYDIWVGPFDMKGGSYVPMGTEGLPAFTDDEGLGTTGTSRPQFYDELYGSDAQKQKYHMVRLSDLKEFGKKPENKEAYEAAVRGIQIIYMEMEDPEFALNSLSRIELSYKMRAPLNLPKYVGDLSGVNIGEDITLVQDYTGWNTFVDKEAGNGMIHEQAKAGVFIDAPEKRGYIGSYVWYDQNYDGEENEAEYEIGENGRPQIKNLTTDLDFDGVNDDPGINGVKVELLSENGYAVNRDGEAVVEEAQPDGHVKYALIDEKTGDYKLTEHGLKAYSDAGPAVAYVTESDYLDHKGYYILSNLKAENENGEPMRYHLRFTFPEEYGSYAVTTLKIGDTENPVALYRPGDRLPDLGNPGAGAAPGDAEEVNTLVVQTTEPVEVSPVEMDGTADGDGGLTPHERYDRRMTSYNVGVARMFTVGGYAWLDEHEDPADPETVLSDGIMDPEEEKLEQIEVRVYEYDEETGALTPAKDVNGNDAAAVTGEDGKFGFHLKPGKYLIKADNKNPKPLKETPYLVKNDPLEKADDNDMLKEDGVLRTGVFEVTYPMDETGKPAMDAPDGPTAGQGYKPLYHIGLGFVSAGRGFIGNTVWNDENYNGLLDMTEKGVPNVSVTLEKYYYDGQEKAWKRQENFEETKVTNEAGNFVFSTLTYYQPEEEGPVYLAGYKMRINREDLKEEKLGVHFGITRERIGENPEIDSNLKTVPRQNPEGELAHYMLDQEDYILVAEEAGESTLDKNRAEYGGKVYDLAAGVSDLTYDAGLKEYETADLSGYLWEDTDYDGIRSPEEEKDPGMEGQTVILEQYVQTSEGMEKTGEWKTQTEESGKYEFRKLSTYYENPDSGERTIAYYRVKLENLPEGYRVTKYRQGTDRNADSDLHADTLYLTQEDAPVLKDYFTVILEAEKPENTGYILTDGQKRYDLLTSREEVTGFDGGLKKEAAASISGTFWLDEDFNGRQDDGEEKLEGVTVKLNQWYLKDGRWVKNENFAERTTVTNRNGDYMFQRLPVFAELDGTLYLAAYRVTESSGASYEATRYHEEGVEEEKNSDLIGHNDDRLDGELSAGNNGYVILAQELKDGDSGNPPYLASWQGKTYDLLQGKEEKNLDGGLMEPETGIIEGYVWEDNDYDGLMGEDRKTDLPKEGETVLFEPYYLNGQGVWTAVPGGETKKAATDSDGRYRLEDATPSVLIEGVRYLAGYRIRLENLDDRYAVTRYQMAEGTELADKDSDLIAETLYLTKPGEYVTAAEKTEEDTDYTATAGGVSYDLRGAAESFGGNAGMLRYQDGMLEGILWQDQDYDGIREEGEGPVKETVQVVLERWSYQADGSWEKDDAFRETAFTDENGHYQFLHLPTHKQTENRRAVYGYKVHIEEAQMSELNQKYAVTPWRQGEDRSVDSDLIAQTGELQTEAEYQIVAPKADEGSNPSNVEEVDGIRYDVASGIRADGLDGGLKEFKTAKLEGTVWLEEDYDGVMEPEEKRLDGVEVKLTQSYWKDGAWEDVEEEEFLRTQTTGPEGNYCFEELPAFVTVGQTRCLAGYRVTLIEESERNQEILENYAVTKYLAEGGSGNDSKLVLSGLKLTGTEEEYEGRYVMAQPFYGGNEANHVVPKDGETGFDLALERDVEHVNAGFVEFKKLGSIGGVVWEDAPEDGGKPDGIRQEEEKRIAGVRVELEQYGLKEGIWEKSEDFQEWQTTREDGSYLFEGLPSYRKDEGGKITILGYKAVFPEMPENYEATVYRANGGTEDSDLDTDTGYLTEKVLALAVPAQETEQPEYAVDGYSIIALENQSGLDAGLVPYRTGYVEGRVWNDRNQNGVQEEEDKGLEGFRVFLDVKTTEEVESTIPLESGIGGDLTDGIEDGGTYLPYAETVSGEDGVYRFENVPAVDENGDAYIYRVRMEKPEKAYYVPLYAADRSVDNDYAHINVPGRIMEQKYGVTESFVLAEKLDHENWYGQSYSGASAGFREHLDLGIHLVENRTVLGGTVFHDWNGNGFEDGNEEGAQGVRVSLFRYNKAEERWEPCRDLNGNSVAVTGEDGVYLFEVEVADLNPESGAYLEPYQYRVVYENTDENWEYGKKRQDRNTIVEAGYGALEYTEEFSASDWLEKIRDVNEASAEAGGLEGLPAAGETIRYSGVYELCGTYYEPYSGKTAAALDEVYADLGRGAALVETIHGVHTGDTTDESRYWMLLAASGILILYFFLGRKKKEQKK